MVQTCTLDMHDHYLIGRYTCCASDDIFQGWGMSPDLSEMSNTAIFYKCWHNLQCFTGLFYTLSSDTGYQLKCIFCISSLISRGKNMCWKWPMATILYKCWHLRWTFISLALTAQTLCLQYTLSFVTSEYISSGSVCTFPYWGKCSMLADLEKIKNAIVLYNGWNFWCIFISLSPMVQTCASDTHDHCVTSR